MKTKELHPTVIILMGVSGSGKSAVGSELARRLGWQFFDGDDFHPEYNIQKMAKGTPLTDEDRKPWLGVLNDLIAEQIALEKPSIIACSALKQAYRDQLVEGNEGAVIVYLRGDFDMIYERIKNRSNHFMKTQLLQSQYETLEDPEEALVISIDQSIESIVNQIINELNLI